MAGFVAAGWSDQFHTGVGESTLELRGGVTLVGDDRLAVTVSQQSGFGGIVSFVVRGGREAAWRLIDTTRVFSITANLGDTKSTITHPASTTHGRITADARKAAGIGDGLLRVAVGLESVEDLKADLARGLDG